MDDRVRPLHTRGVPVFVLGCARSGTSLTCRLLLDHLGVNFGTESQFIVRYYRRLAHYGDLREPAAMRRLLRDISRERFFERTRRNFGFVFDIDRAMASIDDHTYAGAVRAIFEQFAASKQMARWGDKTPEYNRHLDVIRALFPAAQFVHVIRDPRDVAASLLKTGFGSKCAYDSAVAWRDTVTTIERFGASLPPRQFARFRYEDLLDDPTAVVGRLAAFLDISNHEALMTSLATRLRAQVKAGNAGKWRGILPRDRADCIEAVAFEPLSQFGYLTAASAAVRARPVTPVQIAMWRAQGLWVKAGNPKFWTDSAYRLRLRVRDAMSTARTAVRA